MFEFSIRLLFHYISNVDQLPKFLNILNKLILRVVKSKSESKSESKKNQNFIGIGTRIGIKTILEMVLKLESELICINQNQNQNQNFFLVLFDSLFSQNKLNFLCEFVNALTECVYMQVVDRIRSSLDRFRLHVNTLDRSTIAPAWH